MNYIETFKRNITVAERTFGSDPSGRALLHTAILGPPQSGKTTLAEDYARELMAAGMLKTPPVIVDLSKPVSDQHIQFYFDAAKDGMIILKNPHATTRQETLLSRLGGLLENETGILVVTGPKEETRGWLKTRLKWNDDAILETQRSHTEEEQRAFNEGRAAAWQAREDERRREKIISGWRETAELDITAKKNIKAPRRAHFTKKSGR